MNGDNYLNMAVGKALDDSLATSVINTDKARQHAYKLAEGMLNGKNNMMDNQLFEDLCSQGGINASELIDQVSNDLWQKSLENSEPTPSDADFRIEQIMAKYR